MGRRRIRSKQLLDDVKEKSGYWKLKEDALDRNLCRTGFRRGCRPVVWQTAEWMKWHRIDISITDCYVEETDLEHI